jgi:hypothetical protein
MLLSFKVRFKDISLVFITSFKVVGPPVMRSTARIRDMQLRW